MSYTIVDIETTGLSKHRHAITEIAAVKVENGKITDEFQTLVNPEKKIPRFITRLTGIDNELVKDAPTIDKVLPGFLDFLGETFFVAHNASFDYGFLNQNTLRHHNKEIDNKRICTRKLANRILPDLPSKRLGALCDHFAIQNQEAHRAMGDAKVTAKIFTTFLELLASKNISEPEDILKFEQSPRYKCTRILNR